MERMRIVAAQMRRVVLNPHFSRREFRRKGIIRPAAPVPALEMVRGKEVDGVRDPPIILQMRDPSVE